MENAKIQKFKCDILGDFKTLCVYVDCYKQTDRSKSTELLFGFSINNASFNNIRRNSWCFHSENLKQDTTGFKRGKCTDLKRPQVWLYKLHGTLKLLLNFVYLELRSYGHQHHASPKGFQRCFFRTSSLSIFFLERKLRRISSKFCDLCLYFNEGWRNNLTYCTSTWRLQGPKSLL